MLFVKYQTLKCIKFMLNDFLKKVIEKNASDLHLIANELPVLRIDGALKKIEKEKVLSPKNIQEEIYKIINEEQKKILEKEKQLDFSYTFEDRARFRINVYFQKETLAAAFRLIPSEILSIEKLGLPSILNEFTKANQGLILITGPTGHGKTTTLAALIEKINQERACHIVTIEDPIEYLFTPKKSLISQREIYRDAPSFPKSLKACLREDIDVVLVGEMRDFETISTAITIAETGHLVLSTLHTNSTTQTIDRIIDVFPSDQQGQIRSQLADILLGVVSQRLLPKIDGGRIVAAEVLIANSAVRNLIRDKKTYQIDSVIQTSKAQGMIPLDESLASLVKTEKITLEKAITYALDRGNLRSLINHN